MSTFDQHCHESMLRFGQPFEEVHRWLDEFQGTPKYRHAAPPGPPPRSRHPGSEGLFWYSARSFSANIP